MPSFCQGMMHLSPKLNYKNLNEELLKHFARLQTKDSQVLLILLAFYIDLCIYSHCHHFAASVLGGFTAVVLAAALLLFPKKLVTGELSTIMFS